MDIDLSGFGPALEAGGLLAASAYLVRLAIVYGRPALQKMVAREWPASPWVGYLLTGLLAAGAAAASELVTGAGWSWAVGQAAVTALISLLTTRGMDAKTAEMQIFVKDLSKLPTPVTTVDQGGGSLDGPSQPAGPVDPPADAGPT